MKRCSQCIMPESIPGITFNKDGVCNFCADYQPQNYFGHEALDEVLSTIKNHKNKYDCIVPLSGGRDSSYVLYFARAILGLKVMAVNYDNEFRVDQALVNMETACKILDVDFVSYRSKRNIAHKIVLTGIRRVLPFGLNAIRKSLCSACVYGYRSVAYRAALKHNVPLIIWGETKNEATQDIEERTTQAFSTLMRRRLLHSDTYKVRYYKMLQRLEFSVPGNSLFSLSPVRFNNPDIKEIRLFDFIPWERKKIKQTLTKELFWEKPSDHISTWRIDCRLHPLMNYCFIKLLSCSKDCFGYCNMINSGQMSRDEALNQEELTLRINDKSLRDLLETEIGLPTNQANTIMGPSY